MTLLREPLLHFAVVGVILFGGYSWMSDRHVEATAAEPVRIGDGDVRWLKQTWSSQWLREPTGDELKGLVDDLLTEKLLAREAQEIGLEQDDTIIRRRLAQKLKFLVEDTAQLAEPTEADLRQFYVANAAHFETPGKLSFRQVYFNPEHRKDAAADATAALGALSLNIEDDSIEGDRLLFDDSFADTDEHALSGMFGPDFAREVFALEPGRWRGPVKSGYGFHLVLVTQRTATAPKPFEMAKDAVLAEWRFAKQTELSRDYLIELRNKYGVQLDNNTTALLGQGLAPNVAAQ
ncbi:peptidyl-prolyl cis-trans isomerase [Mesorhizobium sp. M7A.F.Ca.US.011.01.1.1]|uniref:peptidylprolyl isomerase n=1 Tax=Mesorhizobium sp. M7A.F.Ca.US.011.01.1.1 TaxID=2496741 RepID=UPI000FCCA4F0|nr:peptidylprolyl isomerase [Mesorhizobium sp. M7A.F.Ca.US.011.01.1.1]RUX28850.1 peptidyl-prolyl cis-trans isomerase [Mesorhizobium sp. M7A.F.Ca.US.011.01.1.1]